MSHKAAKKRLCPHHCGCVHDVLLSFLTLGRSLCGCLRTHIPINKVLGDKHRSIQDTLVRVIVIFSQAAFGSATAGR